MILAQVVEKLKAALFNIESEVQVVYVLVQCRKLIEFIDPDQERYRILSSFCSWALHTKMDLADAQGVLRTMNAVINHYRAGCRSRPAESKQLDGLLNFRDLYKQLQALLCEVGIPANLMMDPQGWFRFARLYASIIEDVPLVYTRKDLPLEHLDRAEVRSFGATDLTQGSENEVFGTPFGIRWIVYLDSKEEFFWDIPFVYYDFHA